MSFRHAAPVVPLSTYFDPPASTFVRRLIRIVTPWAIAVLGFSCAVFLVVDVVGNNWELNDFVGNARHLFTPLLNTRSISDLERDFAFPDDASASAVSMVGRFMVESTLDQVHDKGSNYYALTMSSFVVTNAANDICGQLVDTYPVRSAIRPVAAVRLGTLQDNVSYIRGNTFTHLFGDTVATPEAPPGTHSSVLESMGYVPARVSLDMRLTTAVPLPPPGSSAHRVAMNVTMYRFLSKAFCSGCRPGTELGMDTCAIVYSYDETTNVLTVHNSTANYGESVHVLAMVFLRRWGPVVGLYIRAACVVLAFGAFAVSQKTVRWTDAMALPTWKLRMFHIMAPPVHRHVNHAFDLMFICFNSDVFVFLYSIAILLDEDVAMVYARVVTRWYSASAYEVWMELRLLALTFRWLWLNLAILKLLKVLCNMVSSSRHNGSNFVMGWLTFSSTGWIYLTVVGLAFRTPFIEHGNCVRVDVSSTAEDLDKLFVEFEHSWYLRGLPSVLFLMVGNLFMVLLLDHVANRAWWRLLSRNSLARQFMFNSTSILCELTDVSIQDSKYSSTITIQARTLCTLQWFLTSHLVRFGLPEEQSLLRRLSSNAATKKAMNNSLRHSVGGASDKSSGVHHRTAQTTTGATLATATVDATTPDHDHDHDHATPDAAELYLVVQDTDGYVYAYDSCKREVPTASMDGKAVLDAAVRIQ